VLNSARILKISGQFDKKYLGAPKKTDGNKNQTLARIKILENKKTKI